MPTPNEWRSDIVLVDHFSSHLKELTEDGYTVFSAVQHSVDGYYLVVSYPSGTAGQFFMTASGAKVYDEEVKTAINQLTAVLMGGELPSGAVGLATHDLQHSGVDALYAIRDEIISGNTTLSSIDTNVATSALQVTGNTSLNSINNRVGTSGTTGTAVWELDQIRQLISSGYARDVYSSGIILEDQVGINGSNTLTFTFPQTMDRVHVLVVDPGNLNKQEVMRVDPFGGTPTSTFGMACLLNQEFEIHAKTAQVKVWFSGAYKCTVWGYYYA